MEGVQHTGVSEWIDIKLTHHLELGIILMSTLWLEQEDDVLVLVLQLISFVGRCWGLMNLDVCT